MELLLTVFKYRLHIQIYLFPLTLFYGFKKTSNFNLLKQ